jgi:hypothetical protein
METGISTFALHAAVIILQLIVLHLLSRHLNRTLYSSFGTVIYLLVSLPGTIIHELSHYIGCLITFTRVREVRLFSPHKEGEQLILGYVSHAKPRNPLASFIIGTAPFFGGVFVLWLAAALLVPDTVDGSFTTFVVGLGKSLLNLDWRAFIMLYLLVSVPTHLAPSTRDLKNAAWGIVLAAIIVGLAAVGASFFGWDGSGQIFTSVQSGLVLLTGLLTFALLCCIVVTLVVTAISRLILR